MKIKLTDKLYKNALIGERLSQLTNIERQKVVLQLLKNKSERALGEELGISHSTIHDWKTLRQDNVGSNIHVSLAVIYRKLKGLNAKEIVDWGRIELIKEVVDRLLKQKK